MTNEALRDWARPVLAFLATATALAAVMVAGVTAVLNLGTVAGIGITVTLFAVAAGTGVWWADHKGWL